MVIKDRDELHEKEFQLFDAHSFFLQIYDINKNLLYRSPNLPQKIKVPLKTNIKFNSNGLSFDDINLKRFDLRTAYFMIGDGVNKFFVQISIQNSSYNLFYNRMLNVFLYFFPLVIVIVFLISLLNVRRAFIPVKKISSTARRISVSHLDERIEDSFEGETELEELRNTLNSLFDRLEDQVDRIAKFTDNASHQLITPLTGILNELEFVMKRPRDQKDYETAFNNIYVQTERMINIVKSLLILAKKEDLEEHTQNICSLSSLFRREVIPFYHEFGNIRFSIKDEIYCRGEAKYLSIVIFNLIDNAIKYSPDNTPIKVTLEESGDWVRISVEDKGIGIAQEEIDKLYERFYRSEVVETLGIKGYGLGLSLIKVIVDSVKGKIELTSKLNEGTTFTVLLKRIKFEE